jgi:hypothetical protein
MCRRKIKFLRLSSVVEAKRNLNSRQDVMRLKVVSLMKDNLGSVGRN